MPLVLHVHPEYGPIPASTSFTGPPLFRGRRTFTNEREFNHEKAVAYSIDPGVSELQGRWDEGSTQSGTNDHRGALLQLQLGIRHAVHDSRRAQSQSRRCHHNVPLDQARSALTIRIFYTVLREVPCRIRDVVEPRVELGPPGLVRDGSSRDLPCSQHGLSLPRQISHSLRKSRGNESYSFSALVGSRGSSHSSPRLLIGGSGGLWEDHPCPCLIWYTLTPPMRPNTSHMSHALTKRRSP